jgi:subtilisin family serine protease
LFTLSPLVIMLLLPTAVYDDDDDDDDLTDDGRGTHIAGIIAATRNCKGTVGIAPDAEIYAIEVSDSRGKGSFSVLVKVINWAIENDMDVE